MSNNKDSSHRREATGLFRRRRAAHEAGDFIHAALCERGRKGVGRVLIAHALARDENRGRYGSRLEIVAVTRETEDRAGRMMTRRSKRRHKTAAVFQPAEPVVGGAGHAGDGESITRISASELGKIVGHRGYIVAPVCGG